MPPVAPITINGMPWDVYRKGLDKLFWNSANSVENYIDKLYNVQSVKTKQIKEKSFAGVPAAQPWDPNGDPIKAQAINPRYDIVLTNTWFANAISYTLEHKTFDQYSLMNEAAGQLGMSAAQTKQILGANFFNTGFTGTWNAQEGQPYFSASHPLDPRAGGTYSNLVLGDLSVTTLQQAIALLEGTPDDMGIPMGIKAKRLWVHPNRIFTAMEVLNVGSNLRGDTANNTMNAFTKYGIEIMASPYFTNDKMWMLQGSRTGTIWNNVIDLNSAMYDDDETKITKHEVWFCCVNGARDWRGFVASQGA